MASSLRQLHLLTSLLRIRSIGRSRTGVPAPIFRTTSALYNRALHHPGLDIIPVCHLLSTYPGNKNNKGSNKSNNKGSNKSNLTETAKKRRDGRSHFGRPRVPVYTSAQVKERQMGKTKKDKKLKREEDGLCLTSEAYVQVLGLGTDVGGVAVPSLLLWFDQMRFLFNAGEGLQRFLVEHKVKSLMLNNIFLTQVSTETAGGLLGMLLTLADYGTNENPIRLQVYGPRGIEKLERAVTQLSNGRNLQLTFHTVDPSTKGQAGATSAPHAQDSIAYKDNHVSIRGVVIDPNPRPTVTDASGKWEQVAPEPPPQRNDAGHSRKRQKVGEGEAAPLALSLCYICKLSDIPGKFDLQAAEALGVPRGPMYGELQRGKSVTLPGGQTVQPEEVMSAATPGPFVIVVDCPTMEHLERMEREPALAEFLGPAGAAGDGGAAGVQATCVLHVGPPEVATSERYQSWLGRFRGDPQHIVANAQACGHQPTVHAISAQLQARLHCVHPGIFPPFPQAPSSSAWDGALAALTAEATKVTAGVNNLRFYLRPLRNAGLDRSRVLEPVTPATALARVQQEKPEVFTEVQKLRESLQDVPDPSTGAEDAGAAAGGGAGAVPAGIERDAAELVFLGTGAAMPSAHRNVSGLYLDVIGCGGILMDSGEGTLGQLRRRYGEKEARERIGALQCVWISHIHADHHAGLPSVLRARAAAAGPNAAPLLVIGPRPLAGYLNQWASIHHDLNYTFVDCRSTAPGGMQGRAGRYSGSMTEPGCGNMVDVAFSSMYASQEVPAAVQAAKAQLGLTRLTSIDVVHCRMAYALVLEHDRGWKFVYSGDTRPCRALADAAKGATLLVHEATFEDDLIEEAKAKNHSITKEAVSIGEQAGAYRTILTHFSQRYPKIPVLDESFTTSTAIAFDMMTVNFADLPILPKLLPTLHLLLDDEPEEDNAAE